MAGTKDAPAKLMAKTKGDIGESALKSGFKKNKWCNQSRNLSEQSSSKNAKKPGQNKKKQEWY